MSGPRRKVVADTRELRSGIIDRLRGDPRIDLRVRPHRVGDYWADNELVIERKSLRDFYGSLFQHRLFRQVCAMRHAAARCLLIIEGLHASRTFTLPPPWLHGALLTITAGYQVPIVPSASRATTADLLYALAMQELGGRMGEMRFPKERASHSRVRWLRLRVLQAVPLIGPKRASALLDAFGTLGAVFTASTQALVRTVGVGPELASLIARLGTANGDPQVGRVGQRVQDRADSQL